jgi:hypothetical protein
MANEEPQRKDRLVFFDKCNFINAEMDHDLNASGPIYSAFQYPRTDVNVNYLSHSVKNNQTIFLEDKPDVNAKKDPQINDFRITSRENVKGYCNNSFNPSDINNVEPFPSIEEYIKNPDLYKNNLYEFFKDEGKPDRNAQDEKAQGHISKEQMANQPGTIVSRIFPGLYPKSFWNEYLDSSVNGFVVAPFCKDEGKLTGKVEKPAYLQYYSTYPSGGDTTQKAIRNNIFTVLKNFKWGNEAPDEAKNSTAVITKIDGRIEPPPPDDSNIISGLSQINRINLYLFKMYYVGKEELPANKNNKDNWIWDVKELFDYKTIATKSTIGNPDGDGSEADTVNVFLFVDTINLYNKFPDLTKDAKRAKYIKDKKYHYNIHIIHTVFSLADTASKTGPFDVKKYNPPKDLDNKIRFFSWLYYPKDMDDNFRTTKVPQNETENYDRFDANKILDVGYSVRTSLSTGISLNKKSTYSDIIQLWSPPETKPPFIGLTSENKVIEPRKNSNAPKVRNRIASIYKNWTNINKPQPETPYFNTIPNSDKRKIFLLAQQKKYGDYGQLYAASRFPGTVSKSGFDFDSIKLISGGPPDLDDPNAPPFAKSEERNFKNYIKDNNDWVRDRTFLVTGDWPCFCYTVYNKVNCLFHPPVGGESKDGTRPQLKEFGIRAVF